LPARVVVLTNLIGPYRPAFFRELGQRCGDLQVLVSGGASKCAPPPAEWLGLPVRAQRSFCFELEWRHPHSFRELTAVHVPYDTIPRLLGCRPDVIVSGEFGMRTLQASMFRWVRRNTGLVIWATLSEVTEQGRGWVRHLLRRVLLRGADAVIVNGESGARYIRRFGIEEARIFVVPQTTELEPFLGGPVERRSGCRHRFLFCGRLIELKGLLPFVEALAGWCLAHPSTPAELWVAGDGPVRAALSNSPLPANLTVRFLGHVSYDRLPDVYRECGILAFPTLADEWGLVVVEAMASALPVLGSTYSQAVEELVTDGLDGWLFRPDRPVEVRGALDRALGAPDGELDEMGMRARGRVRQMTPSSMAERMMDAVRYANSNRA
jgi:glycosyltransferase involved in cell wall biosynthesis